MDEKFDHLLYIWGKSEPYQPLLYHMIDAGNVALSLLSTKSFGVVERKFSESTGCPIEICKPWLAYIVALHDIGKCDPDFQAKGGDELTQPLKKMGLRFKKIPDNKFRHEAMSAEWLKNYLRDHHQWGRRAYNTVCEAVKGHHSNFNVESPDEVDSAWREKRNELSHALGDIFNPPAWSPNEFKDSSYAGVLLSGLIVFSDWVASNTELMGYTNNLQGIENYALISRKNASLAIRTIGLCDEMDWQDKTEFGQVWTSSEFANPRPIQRKCAEIGKSHDTPGFVIIEAPMGEGKTEAAIYLATRIMAANHGTGMYVALPTAATSDQMYYRVKSFLDTHDKEMSKRVKLVNGMAWLIDEETPEPTGMVADSIDWFRPKKRSLLSPYAVGTIDQALMSVLNVRFGFLRLFGLTSKVLIVDEVHAYDPYMSSILVTLLKWCSVLGIPVILLSATLPYDKKAMLIKAYSGNRSIGITDNESYPLITYLDHHGNLHEDKVDGFTRPLNVSLVKHIGMIEEPTDIAQLALNLDENGGCICIIMNTVIGAQRVYKELEKLAPPDTKILLYHSRFKANRRAEIEHITLELFDKRSLLPAGNPDKTERPGKAILVATQVVEQSLDLDFDEMITEIAPMDLILQRTGRLHRHNRIGRPTGDQPRLHVIFPKAGIPRFGSTEAIYSRFTLLKTIQVLSNYESFNLPIDIKRLINSTYDSIINDSEISSYSITVSDLKESHDMMENDIAEKAGLSNQYLIDDPRKSEYSIALKQGACSFGEDEEGTRNYFKARTRIADDTITIILLNDDEYTDLINSDMPPRKSALKKVFLNMVNLPEWWLREVAPLDGYVPITYDKKWLMGMPILRLSSGEWRGKGKNGQFTIRDDARLGMIREEIKQ